MGPKVAAATEFVEATGNTAAIGRLEDAVQVVEGSSGTWIEAGSQRRLSCGTIIKGKRSS